MASDPSASIGGQEPVVVYNAVGVIVSVVAALLGFVVDPGAVQGAIAAVVAVAAPVIAAFKARAKVTPVA